MEIKGLFVSLLITTTFFFGCSSHTLTNELADKDRWQFEKNDGGNSGFSWSIYSRTYSGSSFKEFKLTGWLSVSPQQAVAALRERIEHSELYISQNEAYIDVLESKPKELLVYSVFYMPLWLKDRAMCERFEISNDSDTGNHKITWKQEWDSCQTLSGDAIKMPIARGSWSFERTEKGTYATYIVAADPGGELPPWLWNFMVSQGLPKELSDIQAISARIFGS